MDDSLQGRTALVTGAGSGMGRAHAEALAGRGAHIVVQDVVAERTETVAGAIRDSGGSAEPLPGDAADVRAMRAAVER
ncbi:MAG: SDR family NAD(P)-dependent oxidoreductase, partial [Rhodospirillaceae bacterium]|nr:SDR family NAD(P)-dependent oxidoreductase [Rhodospirillaceae bacterium]